MAEDDRRTTLAVSLRADGRECATAEVVAVRVPATWWPDGAERPARTGSPATDGR
jgi:hypothetical protein